MELGYLLNQKNERNKMSEKKQITIYELLPLLRKGFVCMEPYGEWEWFKQKPDKSSYAWSAGGLSLHRFFDIKKFDGDWKDSLMEVKNNDK